MATESNWAGLVQYMPHEARVERLEQLADAIESALAEGPLSLDDLLQSVASEHRIAISQVKHGLIYGRVTRRSVEVGWNGVVTVRLAPAPSPQTHEPHDQEQSCARTYIDTPYSDTHPAPPIHDEVGCIEWCAHCALCGAAVLYGARCPEHYGMYPKPPESVGPESSPSSPTESNLGGKE